MADSAKLRRLFPRASKAFFQANPDTGLQDTESKRVPGETLDKVLSGTEAGYERTHLCITAFTVRPRDQDNLAGGCKALIDAVKVLHLITNDDPYSIELEIKQRHVDHFNQEKTLIEITYR